MGTPKSKGGLGRARGDSAEQGGPAGPARFIAAPPPHIHLRPTCPASHLSVSGAVQRYGSWSVWTLNHQSVQCISRRSADDRSFGRQPEGPVTGGTQSDRPRPRDARAPTAHSVDGNLPPARTRPNQLSPGPVVDETPSPAGPASTHGGPVCRRSLAVWRTRRVPDLDPATGDAIRTADSGSMNHPPPDRAVDQPPRQLDRPSCRRRSR